MTGVLKATEKPAAAFQNTLWSKVLRAGALDSQVSRAALEDLCRAYWDPIYNFLRRCGNDREAARDLTQGFFHYFLEENIIRKANPKRGRFRSFLLGVLQNFAANEKTREMAVKRGGRVLFVSIDEETAEGQYLHEPFTNVTPEKLFEKRWALAVVKQALDRLRDEHIRGGSTDLFAALEPYLSGDTDGSFAELGKRINKTEQAARVWVFRIRARFRQLLRSVIADTVPDMEAVETELRDLQAALRG